MTRAPTTRDRWSTPLARVAGVTIRLHGFLALDALRQLEGT